MNILEILGLIFIVCVGIIFLFVLGNIISYKIEKQKLKKEYETYGKTISSLTIANRDKPCIGCEKITSPDGENIICSQGTCEKLESWKEKKQLGSEK